MTRTTDRRAAFTLVELLVAAAISVIIMTVLTVCFQTGTDAIRQMRAQGDLTSQLRAVGEVLRRDMTADHFADVESNTQPSNPVLPGRRLSDYDFTNTTTPPTIKGGYVRIDSGVSSSEGPDSDGFESTRANNHTIRMTSIQPFATDTPPYIVTSSGTPFTSRAAEIAYFLGSPSGAGTPTGQTAGPNGVSLFNLYRQQRLVALSAADTSYLTPAATSDPAPSEILSMSGGAVNTLGTLAQSGKQSATVPFTSGNRFGNDILLSNVISFEVKLHWTGTTPPRTFPANTDDPYDTLSPQFTSSIFDTTSSPLPTIRVHGVMIRVRAYDAKTQTARQATYVFDQ